MGLNVGVFAVHTLTRTWFAVCCSLVVILINRKSEVGSRKSEVGSRKSELGSRNSEVQEVGTQKLELGTRTSELKSPGSRNSEVGSRKSEVELKFCKTHWQYHRETIGHKKKWNITFKPIKISKLPIIWTQKSEFRSRNSEVGNGRSRPPYVKYITSVAWVTRCQKGDRRFTSLWAARNNCWTVAAYRLRSY